MPSKAMNVPTKALRFTPSSWCECFSSRSNEPPEITLSVVKNDGVVSLQPVTPTLPMPDNEEIDQKFSELVDDLDLTGAKREVMFHLPPEKKWQIYCSKKMELDDSNKNSPSYYIEKVNSMAEISHFENDADVKAKTKQMESVRTALRTKANSFVTGFLESNGLACLLNFLSNMTYEVLESPVHTSVIGCFKALMNNSSGREYVLSHPNTIGTIAQSLVCENVKTKIATFEILGAVCLVNGGHKTVLNAMLHFQKYAGERTRFQTVINDLDKNRGDYHDEVCLKTAIMSFINATLNYGPGQDHLEFRVHLRYELLMLGILQIVDKMRSYDNETLNRHIDFFELVRLEDDKEIARKFESVHIDTKSASRMFDALQRKLLHTNAYPHLLSLLQHCLLIPRDQGSSSQYWLLLDRILQQVVLQRDIGDPDISIVDVNVQEIVQLLATEEEQRLTKEKAENLEVENQDLSNKLQKTEQKLDCQTAENEDKLKMIKRLHEKLSNEQENHVESKKKIFELECQITELQVTVECEKMDKIHKQSPAKTSNSSDFKCESKVEVRAPVSAPPPPPLPNASKIHTNGISAPTDSSNKIKCNGIPPPPPPVPSAPLPPSMKSANHLPKRNHGNIPKSTNPLKSFNWSKLPENKVHGTIWTELDDSNLYKDLDLYLIDKTFSAFQRQNDGSNEDLRIINRNTKLREFSVIDGRRAQNLTILLSKLKMSNEDICKCIYSMDKNNQLAKDMVEQLLKFMPSSEEKALLEENSTAIEQMAKADRFLFEISRISHYQQRFKVLNYKKKFNERINDCKPKIEDLRRASTEVKQSRRLKKLLEIVLAMGNYMNKGQRGNAYGFKLSSLNKLADTKASTNKSITLLHFITSLISTKFKDLTKLQDDISSVRKACKVNMQELNNDINSLTKGMNELKKELEFHHSHPDTSVRDDLFVPAMEEFAIHAGFKCSGLEEMFQDMKLKYEEVTELYGEDSSQMQPEEFFGVLNTFLNAFQESLSDKDVFRKINDEKNNKEETEKNNVNMKKEITRISTKSNAKSKPVHNNHYEKPNGEFDDLISALRTGDVFGEDIAKMKRTSRRRGSQPIIGMNHSQSPSPTRVDSMKYSNRERVNRKY